MIFAEDAMMRRVSILTGIEKQTGSSGGLTLRWTRSWIFATTAGMGGSRLCRTDLPLKNQRHERGEGDCKPIVNQGGFNGSKI